MLVKHSPKYSGKKGGVVVHHCRHCRQPYKTERCRPGTFCSPECCQADRKLNPLSCLEGFIHQPGDKLTKTRANGLINMRIKRGTVIRPASCERCGKAGRVDACHIDYDLPHVVTFACRSCHMKSHRDPAIEAELVMLAKPRGELPPGYTKAREVYDVNTNQRWESLTACAVELGVSQSSIGKAIRLGHRVQGRTIAYTGPRQHHAAIKSEVA